MIEEFNKQYFANLPELRAIFEAKHPDDYEDVFRALVSVLRTDEDGDSYRGPDPERITAIDHGNYQGTLLFIVAAKGYQPTNYWATRAEYGSCSYCDTLQDIRKSVKGTPTKAQVKQYMALALHLLQKMVRVG